MKRLSISVSDWVVDSYLFNANNISNRIEELIIKGSEVEEGKFDATKRRVLMLKDELKLRDEEIAKLKQHIGRLETAIDKQQGPRQTEMAHFENINPDAVQCVGCGGLISEDGKRHNFEAGIVCDTCFLTGNNKEKWIPSVKSHEKVMEEKENGI